LVGGPLWLILASRIGGRALFAAGAWFLYRHREAADVTIAVS
jgi:hypothetical protein